MPRAIELAKAAGKAIELLNSLCLDDQTLIETRGEGGYALAPGCPADCHDTGRLYEHHSGPKLSQVRDITQSERDHGVRKSTEIPWKERDHALFTAFAPVGAPRYVCAVVIEHGGETGGGGSAAAAPICRDVLIEAQRRDPARRLPEPATVSEAPIPAPAPSLAAAIAPRRL